MKVTIRPDAIGFATIEMEHTMWGSQTKELCLFEAVDQFAHTIGLIANKHNRKDPDGIPFVEFTLGTGRKFVAFEKLEG